MITTTATDLAAAKSDLPALMDALDLAGQRPGNHHGCRFCGDKTGLSVFQTEGGWRFRCHCCGVNGTIIDTTMLVNKCSAAEAIKNLGVAPAARTVRPTAPPTRKPDPVPVPDANRVFNLMQTGLTTVLEGRADRWLSKRGISAEWIAKTPILGFVERAVIQGWKRPVENAWVILVLDVDGTYRAVKLHRENVHDGPKALWAPFGIEPAEQPRHGYAALWPCPEWFPADAPLYITEGELKTAPLCSMGWAATSPTTGSGFKWTPAQAARFNRRRVTVVYDDDEAGHKFRDATMAALTPVANALRSVTLGTNYEG
jgi:hypothetical protein